MSSRPKGDESAARSRRSAAQGSPQSRASFSPGSKRAGSVSPRSGGAGETVEKVKLIYHTVGAAEPIKHALQIASIPFEEQKVAYEEWKAMRSIGPILIVNGRKIKQTQAILRFIGKLNNSGLYPTDPREAMIMDELLDLVRDLRSRIGSMKYGTEEQKAEKCSNVIDCLIPDLFEKIDDRVENSPTGFLFGKEITVADLEVASMSTFVTKGTIEGVPKNILDPFPNVLRVHYNVMRHPKISRNKARCGDSP
eukprot:GEMP01068088.1.p1 GENE.GEMP01068088.1~~GEMP01068088.1.p1  ORF type:complete len:294 (-),score=62.63 GEMP01068088.1:397-1152(-)